MRRLVLLVVVLMTACAPAVVAPSATPEATASPSPVVAVDTPTPVPATPTPIVDRQSVQVPMPSVALKAQAFPMGVAPVPQRVPQSQLGLHFADGYAQGLMQFLDGARGTNRVGPMSQEEWDSKFWPSAFSTIAHEVATKMPPAGRYFYADAFTIDAVWALPWAVPLGDGTSSAFQFVDVTVKFRDHAETPPADGELFYTWHLRLPSFGGIVYAIADGYDGGAEKTWTSTGPTWDRASLEREATSAAAGYLWNESYVKGGNVQFASAQDTTPFWHERISAINGLNGLFTAGRLTERRFENASVRIDGFDPLGVYGFGIVSVTLAGSLVETLDGKTLRVDFTQPMKFFRFGAGLGQLAGWTAVDSFEDGEWVSGGNLALDKLSTQHG